MDERYIFRAAKKSDYEDVLDINHRVYYGWDYIPGKYLDYMDNWFNYAIVAEDRQTEKLVSFELATTVDDGETLVGRAGRTRSDYLQQGMSHQLDIHLAAQLPYHLRRNLESQAFTTASLTKNVYDRHLNKGTPKLSEKPVILLTEDYVGAVLGSYNDSLRRSTESANMTRLNTSEVGALFASTHTPLCFTGNERVIVTSVPFRRGCPLNATILQEMEDVTVFASHCGKDDYTCLSFGTYIPMPHLEASVRFDVDIYSNDMREIQRHLQCLLHQAAMTYRGRTIYTVCTITSRPNDSSGEGDRERVVNWAADMSMSVPQVWGPWSTADLMHLTLALFEQPWIQPAKL